MHKRTCDFDKLHDLLDTITSAGYREHLWEDVRDALAAAFPLAEPAPTTHNLTPLPESEWPEWHENWCEIFPGSKELYRIGDVFLISYVDAMDGVMWAATNKDDTVWGDEDWGMWNDTPASALRAAGLPVELLDGLNRRSDNDEKESSDSGAGPAEMKNDRTPSKTPAHENPRVVAAAVEMVKEVEQRAKDREEWMAQFPAWVAESLKRWHNGEKITPLRIIGDAGFGHYSAHGWVSFQRGVGTCYGWKTMSGVARDSLGGAAVVYADGNVPLWGDEVKRWANDEESVSVRDILGRTFDDGNGDNWTIDECHLVRRHPAIADLPGIRNDSSADRPDSNDSDSDVTTSPPPATEANKSTKVADKYSGFVSSSEPDKSTVVADKHGEPVGAKPSVTADNDRGNGPKPRVGMRVKIGDSETGTLYLWRRMEGIDR